MEVVEMVIFEKDKVEGINDFSDLEGKVMLPPAFHNHPIVEKELIFVEENLIHSDNPNNCLLYTSPSPRDRQKSRMPSSA